MPIAGNHDQIVYRCSIDQVDQTLSVLRDILPRLPSMIYRGELNRRNQYPKIGIG